MKGDIHLTTKNPLEGRASIRIGPGPGSVSQKVQVGPDNHMMISAIIHSEPAGSGKLTLRFLDKNGEELMSVDSTADMRDSKDPGKIDHYMKPHPLTGSVEVILSKKSASGFVEADQVGLRVYEENDPALQSSEELNDIMKPFWEGSTVSREAVLMLSIDGRPAEGTLMFIPKRILSVTDYSTAASYDEGIDYSFVGRTLVCTSHSRMTQVKDEELLKGELKWNKIGGKQVLVTYEHADMWTGPVQPYIGDHLPKTMQKLSAHSPMKIVAYGDSITFGLGSSRINKIAPFQPPWIELFTREMQQNSGDREISLYNSSQSGATSNWARQMAQRMVASLDPDIVVIAFGQNDFSSVSADTFQHNILSVIQTVRATNPQAEFLLVSTMRYDPAYTSKADYWDRVGQYDTHLQALTGPGVQLVDMTAISGAVFAAKKPKDCLNDPLHPNDYLARWYAQSMIAALTPAPVRYQQR